MIELREFIGLSAYWILLATLNASIQVGKKFCDGGRHSKHMGSSPYKCEKKNGLLIGSLYIGFVQTTIEKIL